MRGTHCQQTFQFRVWREGVSSLTGIVDFNFDGEAQRASEP